MLVRPRLFGLACRSAVWRYGCSEAPRRARRSAALSTLRCEHSPSSSSKGTYKTATLSTSPQARTTPTLHRVHFLIGEAPARPHRAAVQAGLRADLSACLRAITIARRRARLRANSSACQRAITIARQRARLRANSSACLTRPTHIKLSREPDRTAASARPTGPKHSLLIHFTTSLAGSRAGARWDARVVVKGSTT